MHVGHLRSTIMGESISRILEFQGNEVVRVNHLGDWGTQFGMLILHMQQTYPDYLTRSPSVTDLSTFYKEAKKRFDEDSEFKKAAQLKVVELQSGNEQAKKAWQILCDISMEYFNRIYQRLDITNTAYGESYYNQFIPRVI